jgi:hypothetical protein
MGVAVSHFTAGPRARHIETSAPPIRRFAAALCDEVLHDASANESAMAQQSKSQRTPFG